MSCFLRTRLRLWLIRIRVWIAHDSITPPDRLGIRESIIGRIKRRGGTVEIVSRAGWGTEVRMHMPIALKAAQGEHR